MSRAQTHNARGLAFLMGAVVCFAGMDASAKWLSRELSPLMVALGRYAFALVFALGFLRPWSQREVMVSRRLGLQGLRGLFLVITTLSVFTALKYLPLSQVTAINFASPLVTALLAGPFLGEKIGPRRLVAVCVGFVGVLVVTRPFGHAPAPATLFALLAAASNSGYVLTTRILSGHDSSETTFFYTSVLGLVASAPLVGMAGSGPAHLSIWAVLALLGGLGALGHWFLIVAHRLAPASFLAPFFYTQIVGSVLLGYLFFAEVPDVLTWVGGAIVIASGLYLLMRERAQHKIPSVDVV